MSVLAVRCDHVIVAGAEKALPSGDSKRKDALQFVVVCLVKGVCRAGKQSEATCAVHCRA